MTTTLLTSAVSGMLAAQIGLQTAQHNISNQTTAGYNRQRIIQATNVPNVTGYGFIGQGTHVSTVERMYDRFLSEQVNTAQASASSLDSYYKEISQIDNMLADASSGLSPSLENFFTGVKEVAANPAQTSSRQTMLSNAQALVSRYQSIDSRLQELYSGVNDQLVTQVGTVNSYAQQIAQINQSIIDAQASTNQPANDLLDQRDQLVANLNKLISVTTTVNTDGSYNVFFGTGQQLVVGTQVNTLTAAQSSADPSRIAVGMANGTSIQELPESLISGGSISGLLKFRSEALDKTANEVGRNAASLALTFNAQNALGQDLLGRSSGDIGFTANFFTLSQPRVVANSHNSTQMNAVVTAQLTDASYSADPVVGGGNFYTKLTGSDYRLSLDGGNYTLVRLSDNKQWTDTDLQNLSDTISASEGFSFSASPAMASGDSFLIQPTREGARNVAVNAAVASDVRLIAAGMAVKTAASTSNSGSGKISAATILPGYSSAIAANNVSLKYTAGSATPLQISNLPANTVVSYTIDGVTSSVTADAAGVADFTYKSGMTITYGGVSFSLSGNLSDNDTFTLSKNAAGVSDSRNAALLLKLQTQYTMSGGATSFSTAYAQLVSDVGNKTNQASVMLQAQESLLEQSQSARDALSGVNLDEEAANLIKFQQAYQASAKALQIGTNLFDTLIGIMQ